MPASSFLGWLALRAVRRTGGNSVRGCLVLSAVVLLLVALFSDICTVILSVDCAEHGCRCLSKRSLIAGIAIGVAGFVAESMLKIAFDEPD